MKPVCIVCSFRPLTTVGRFLGFSPISVTCSTQSNPCSFSPSLRWIMVSVLQNIFVTTMMVFNVIYLTPEWIVKRIHLTHPRINPNTSTISNVFMVIEFIQFFTAFMLLFLNVFQCRRRARALEKIAKYLHHAGPGVERSIMEKDESLLFWMAARQATIIVIVLILNILYVYIVWPGKQAVADSDWWLIAKSFSNGICTLMVLMAGFEVSLVMTLFRVIVVNLDRQLRMILCSANMRKNSPKETSVSIFHRIVRIRRSHMKIIDALVEFNGSVNPQLAILTCLVMISLVLNCYIVGQYAFNSAETTTRLIITSVRLLINITIVLYMIYKADQVLQKNELMFRMVTSVPAVTLSIDELIQLEVLSQQIFKSPPLFSASGIFAFHAGIVAKMFGTVITYIIVALQFDIRIFTESIEAIEAVSQ